MITAGSYMFPTIDCSDEERGMMRSKEVELREKVRLKCFIEVSSNLSIISFYFDLDLSLFYD